MSKLSNLSKSSLIRTSLARQLPVSGTKKEIIGRIEGTGPFGINLNSSQEEKILSLFGISDYQLRKYLYAGPEDDRETLIEKLLNEELTEKSVEILMFQKTPLKTLQKLAGNNFLNRPDLIRKILNLKPIESFRDLDQKLSDLGFSLILTPEKIEPKPLTTKIFEKQGLRRAIASGQNVSTVSIEIIEEIVDDYLLFQRELTDEEMIEIVMEAIISPVLQNWKIIRDFLKRKTFADLQLLVESWGYPKLNETKLEFLLSRGYLRGINRQISSELFLNFIDKNEVENPKFIEFLKKFDELEPKNAITFAESNQISLSWKNPEKSIKQFWENAELYIKVNTDLKLNLQNLSDSEKDLKKYSDFELIKYFPSAPYNRKKLVKKFKKYWEDDKWFFIEPNFYFGNSKHYEQKEQPNPKDLSWEELIDLVGWLNNQKILRGNFLVEICRRIKDLDMEVNVQEYQRTNLLKEFLQILFLVGGLGIGSESVGEFPNKYLQVNEELLVSGLKRIKDSKNNFDFLDQMPIVDLVNLTFLEETLNDEIIADHYLIETAVFYLAKIFELEEVQHNFILTRRD